MSTITWIHVNKNRILSRLKGNTDQPVIRVQKGRYGQAVYGEEIGIYDSQGNEVARFISEFGDKPLLPCGARVAVRTDLEVRVIR
jgi:hypothetical protein